MCPRAQGARRVWAGGRPTSEPLAQGRERPPRPEVLSHGAWDRGGRPVPPGRPRPSPHHPVGPVHQSPAARVTAGARPGSGLPRAPQPGPSWAGAFARPPQPRVQVQARARGRTALLPGAAMLHLGPPPGPPGLCHPGGHRTWGTVCPGGRLVHRAAPSNPDRLPGVCCLAPPPAALNETAPEQGREEVQCGGAARPQPALLTRPLHSRGACALSEDGADCCAGTSAKVPGREGWAGPPPQSWQRGRQPLRPKASTLCTPTPWPDGSVGTGRGGGLSTPPLSQAPDTPRRGGDATGGTSPADSLRTPVCCGRRRCRLRRGLPCPPRTRAQQPCATEPRESGRPSGWQAGGPAGVRLEVKCPRKLGHQGDHGSARTPASHQPWGREAGCTPHRGGGPGFRRRLQRQTNALTNTTKAILFQVQVKPNSEQLKWLLEPA